MTTAAELTPHQWQQPEDAILRAIILTCAHGRYQRMAEHLAALTPQANADLWYGLNILHPLVEMRAEKDGLIKPRPMPPYPAGTRHDSIKVPCGRCGHDERNEEPVTDYSVSTGTATSVTYCPDCPDGKCQPVVIPAGIEGWPIEGRTK